MTPSNRRRIATGAIACAVALWAVPGSAQEAATLTHGSPASVGMDAGLLDEAVQLYRDAVARDELKGAVLMVARQGVIVMQEAIGWRHEAYQLPMEHDTIFRMASNTKPVVATAALILQEEGRLSLDDTVATHLDSFDTFRSRDITIQQLLTHASGFRIGPIFYPFDEDEMPTLLGAVARFGAEGPEVEPGTSYSYSNAGFNTLGAVIEVASGMPLEEFLRTRIYEPLGMVHRERRDLVLRARLADWGRRRLGAQRFGRHHGLGRPVERANRHGVHAEPGRAEPAPRVPATGEPGGRRRSG